MKHETRRQLPERGENLPFLGCDSQTELLMILEKVGLSTHRQLLQLLELSEVKKIEDVRDVLDEYSDTIFINIDQYLEEAHPENYKSYLVLQRFLDTTNKPPLIN